ncbi:2-oxoacid:ferredoxin oxidoreductase subunit alpha [Acidilobus sp.]|uniref:2-oxoacid:ferredoxin oxidoreductase subunit alpha n=1 Tax=Acidilobus sp. TaxID=1872109 RepID=UPI003D0071F8
MSEAVDLDVMIGGPQGGGIESSGQMMLRVFMLKGYNVFGIREYHSDIIGAHSYYNVRVKASRPRSVRLPADALLALDAEAIFTHYNELKEGSYLIYDVDSLQTRIEKIAPMEPEVKERVIEDLKSKGVEPIASELVKYLSKNGIKAIGLPLKDLLKQTADRLKTTVVSVSKSVNTMTITALATVLGIDLNAVERSINLYFSGRKSIIDSNVEAARVTYEYVRSNFGVSKELPDGPHRGKVRMIATGNDIVAMAKIVGGVGLETYYPITPSQDEAFYMESHRVFDLDEESSKALGTSKMNSLTLQAEDELAALNMAIGGAIAGARVATTTSGPGLSLMNEAISFAVMAEVPVVISDWMRTGPSTGIATRQGQQDLLHAIFAGHGEAWPKIVIASGDHLEAYYDTIKALNWAEQFQVPVIHLLDKYMAASMMSFDREDVDPYKVPLTRGNYVSNPGPDYRRYEITEDGISPRAPLGSARFVVSSLEHNEYGIVTEDPATREKMMLKRIKKMEAIERGIPDSEKAVLHGDPDAKITIVSWGSTKGPILDAMERLRADGLRVRFLQIKTFLPFPTEVVRGIISSSDDVIAVENNAFGQMVMAVRMFTGLDIKKRVAKLNSRSLMEQEVYNGVKKALGMKEGLVVVSDGS